MERSTMRREEDTKEQEYERGGDGFGMGLDRARIVSRWRRPFGAAALLLAAITALPATAADLAAFGSADGSSVVASAGAAAPALGATTRGATSRDAARAAGLLEDGLWMADRVHVDKGERKLHLMHRGEIMRSYAISLGKNPIGHKRREGDMRTPEGEYVLDWRNPGSDFFMSMHISYPNEHDLRDARRRGVNPGSMIMIHGLPNDAEASRTDYLFEDWTDGCIAVSNQAMIDIWLSVPDNTPISITP
jgi:L,D-peptidoglycan transpeptidase YkuD (ErfK/YbiS/YcfS/YnhG family)